MELSLPPALREALLPVAAKRAMLRALAPGITTLALGSSHGDFGFDPGFCAGGFNLCSRSQDFRHSLAIYRRTAMGLPRLSSVVLFYSVFSPGHVLENSPAERVQCVALHELLDLDLRYDDPGLAAHAGTLKRPLAGYSPQVESRAGFLPRVQKSFFPASYGAERRAQEHLKLNRGTAALAHLLAMLIEARRRGHRLLIVVPPARSDYRSACTAAGTDLFRGLGMIRRELAPGLDLDVLDLFADPAFADAHFGDFDHLAPTGQGPAILSALIERRLGAA